MDVSSLQKLQRVVPTAMERTANVTPAYIKVHDMSGRNTFVASRSGTATLDRARRNCMLLSLGIKHPSLEESP